MTNKTFTLDPHVYQQFLRRFYAGEFQGKRLGQAFFDNFRLHRMSDQESLGDLYEEDGEQAIMTIRLLFLS